MSTPNLMSDHPSGYQTPQQAAEYFLLQAAGLEREAADLSNESSIYSTLAKVELIDRANQLRTCAEYLKEFCILRWTPNTPTQEGYYWARLISDKPDFVNVRFLLHVYQNSGNWYVMYVDARGAMCSMEELIRDTPNVEWFGPLQEPPKD